MKYHNIPTLFDNQASLINGKNIGTDSVRYIQDAGQKTAGTTYIDRNTNELYVCVTTTDSVNNDSNFSKFNLKEAFNKLDRLKFIPEKIWSGSSKKVTLDVIRNYNVFYIWLDTRAYSLLAVRNFYGPGVADDIGNSTYFTATTVVSDNTIELKNSGNWLRCNMKEIFGLF